MGIDNPRAGKRIKLEDVADVTASTSVRAVSPSSLSPQSEHLWFEDGSLVIVATGMSFMIKVHVGILKLQSSVFRQLLDAPSDDSEVVEGCRVLRVNDDGPTLAALLLIMCEGGKR